MYYFFVFILLIAFPVKHLFSKDNRDLNLRIYIGYGFYGSGNIINSSGEGLELIEKGINSGYLYSPIWTPIILQFGPIYKNPDFDLDSYSFDLQFLKKLNKSEYGISINYFEMGFTIDLPETYLNFSKIFENANYYLPVTKEIKKRTLLVSVVQLDFLYNYYFWEYLNWNFYFGSGIGIGFGKLAYSGPYVQEIHFLINLGAKVDLDNYSIIMNIKNTGHTAKTGPSNFIDRRKVLVNPRRGEIIVNTFQIGVSFPLTF